MAFHKEKFQGFDNGSRPAIVLPFLGNDAVGAVTDSGMVNIAQTSATDANEKLPTLEQRSSSTGGATSTTIDISQRVSSASGPHKLQMKVESYSNLLIRYT